MKEVSAMEPGLKAEVEKYVKDGTGIIRTHPLKSAFDLLLDSKPEEFADLPEKIIQIISEEEHKARLASKVSWMVGGISVFLIIVWFAQILGALLTPQS